MPQYIDVEPEYMWKCEPTEGGAKLLTIAVDNGPDIRIVWDAEDANKLSQRMASVETATTDDMKDLTGGSSDSNSGNRGT